MKTAGPTAGTSDPSTSGRVPSEKNDADAAARWQAALHGDRTAFQALVAPYLPELRNAAQRELRYRISLGDLDADDLTADELVGEVLIRAWNDRHRRPPQLGVRAWLLALLFRVVRCIVRREARFRSLKAASLEDPVPPDPDYDDDESFWEWYQPDEMTRWEDVTQGPSATSLQTTPAAPTPEDAAAEDEAFTRGLSPTEREALLMDQVHAVPLPEIAVALGMPVDEAARMIAQARRRVGILDDGEPPP